MESYVTFLSVAFVIEHDIADEPHNCDYFSLGKGFAVFVYVYRGKEWNKAIHNALTLPFVLTWYCHAVKTQRWRPKSFREWRHILKIQDDAQTY